MASPFGMGYIILRDIFSFELPLDMSPFNIRCMYVHHELSETIPLSGNYLMILIDSTLQWIIQTQ